MIQYQTDRRGLDKPAGNAEQDTEIMKPTNFPLPPSFTAARMSRQSSGMFSVSRAAVKGGGFDLSEVK